MFVCMCACTDFWKTAKLLQTSEKAAVFGRSDKPTSGRHTSYIHRRAATAVDSRRVLWDAGLFL